MASMPIEADLSGGYPLRSRGPLVGLFGLDGLMEFV
jgi:hypothetical protein